MLPLIVGLVMGVVTGATAGAVLAHVWRLARIGAIGAPVLAGFAGGCASALLQLLGAGELRFQPEIGLIDWRPVVSTLVASGGVGFIAIGAIGLTRTGSRYR